MAFSWELADHRFQCCVLSFYMSSGIILGSGCVKSPLLCLCVVQLSISLCTLFVTFNATQQSCAEEYRRNHH